MNIDSIPTNKQLISKLRSWNADNTHREDERIKRTGEVFTPTYLVQEMLNNFPDDSFKDISESFLDPCCGNGQFLSEILIRKLESGISLDAALRKIYGIDIMLDNVKICRERLLCGVEQYRYIVENNIICADALTFNFDSWKEAPSTDPNLSN